MDKCAHSREWLSSATCLQDTKGGGLIKAMCSHAWKSILRLCVLYLFISDTQLEKEEEEKKYKKVPFK